ncbi:MAG: hypothetical protein ACOX80_01335 [Methanomassiliicoccaceae archaeon]|jgi:hypothetical protein|nr:hypothetical protein [Euryarchaeota archaeon]HOQ26516.1 hypothetical protein [Methanomassiliicoccaceae archaeon]HQA21740.1 hypothetical protein [Methanomassiliicoccaceae archaeon]HQD88685.1 hypothetical protein [Methanomassiliicoccaceae archaeon]
MHLIGIDMLTSMRFEPYEGKEDSGRMVVYLRKSFTCRVPIGHIEYENAEEKEALRKIWIKSRPDVEEIGPEVTVGLFHEVYFKR